MLIMKKTKKSYPKIYFLRSSPLGYDTVSLQIVPLTKESGYVCVHFRTNALGKKRKSVSPPPSYGFNN